MIIKDSMKNNDFVNIQQLLIKKQLLNVKDILDKLLMLILIYKYFFRYIISYI